MPEVQKQRDNNLDDRLGIFNLVADAPPDGGNANVQKYTGSTMPPGIDTRHYLCSCSGTASQPNPYYLYGVFALCRTDRFPTDAEAITGAFGVLGRYVPVGNYTASAPWQFAMGSSGDNRVRADEGTNFMRLVAQWYVMGSGGPTVVLDGKNVKFTGVVKDTCAPTIAEAKHSKVAFSASVAPVSMIEPSSVEDDWLLYDRIPVGIGALGDGHTLAFRGSPLRARILAVAAENVQWQRGWDRPIVVRRPSGEPVVAGPTFRFPNTPENAIAIHQPSDFLSSTRCTKIVTSECTDHPDIVGLYPDQDVNVQVNYSFFDVTKMTGWYSLRVKVLV